MKYGSDTFPSNTVIKKFLRYLFTLKSGWFLRCICFIEIDFIESQIHYILSDAYGRTEDECLNSYDQEHCLYNRNRLKPHPKYWERGESKQLQRIITYSVLLRK